MSRPGTPADLTITPRDRRFGRGAAQARWWMGGDPVATAFYNALSATFPKGEGFFVESVRRFRDGAPPKLAEEIKAFTTQEVMHSREHVQFNKRALDAGYDLTALEEKVDYRLAVTRAKPPIVSLAATMCLEHFTAILAHELLKDPRHLGSADAESAAMWRWHAIEEIEHKAVAYDTFLVATADMTRLRRYVMRSFAMILATVILFTTIRASMRDLYHADGLKGWRIWRPTIAYLFGGNGILRRIFPAWLTYFRPGFHPWQHDDRDVLARAQARLGLDAAA